jgi:hypothetical protein
MFARKYFAGAYFAPTYFPPVVSAGPAPRRDARAYGEESYDYIERDDEEIMELISIFLFALEEA